MFRRMQDCSINTPQDLSDVSYIKWKRACHLVKRFAILRDMQQLATALQ